MAHHSSKVALRRLAWVRLRSQYGQPPWCWQLGEVWVGVPSRTVPSLFWWSARAWPRFMRGRLRRRVRVIRPLSPSGGEGQGEGVGFVGRARVRGKEPTDRQPTPNAAGRADLVGIPLDG